MPTNLVILGAGPGAEEVADLAHQAGDYEVIAFVEGIDRERCGQELLGRPILWLEEVASVAGSAQAVCAVGSTKRKGFIERAMEMGLAFTSLVHPGADLSPTASLGSGTIVFPGVVVAAYVTVGAHVQLKRGCLIGHHTTIGDFVTVGPGANVAGLVTIGERAYVGIGAVVVDRISIGRESFVSAGAVVTRDVAARTQVFGVPAGVVREGVEGF